MENRKIKILCILHYIDFDNDLNKHITYLFIESDKDRGLAIYEVKEKVKELNNLLSRNFRISVSGIYTGNRRVKTYLLDDLNMKLIKIKIREGKAKCHS